jgi:hypothetical protein
MSLLAALLLSAFARADVVQPSVWEQMENGTANPIEALVTDLDFRSNAVVVTLETKENGSQSAQLCSEAAMQADQKFQNSEEMRGHHFSQTAETLREALRSNQKVLIGMKGPWSSCIESVKISSKNKTALLE